MFIKFKISFAFRPVTDKLKNTGRKHTCMMSTQKGGGEGGSSNFVTCLRIPLF